jgi:hypothetical protein
MTILAGQIPTAAELNALVHGTIIARGRRTTSTTTTTTSLGVLRLDDIPITSGRAYSVHTSGLALDGGTTAAVALAIIRYTTDGSTPTTSSNQFPGGWTRDVTTNTTDGPIHATGAIYVPSSDETLSLLLCIQSGNGAVAVQMLGDATFPIDMWVVDHGTDPGDTGVDI